MFEGVALVIFGSLSFARFILPCYLNVGHCCEK